MPEAPDLFVNMEFLEPRLAGRTIVAAEERKPLVLRNMVDQKFSGDIAARKITAVHRKGKLLLLSLGDERGLVISPMLTDDLRYCSPFDRIEASTVLTFDLDDGHQLRYFDQKRMGEVYHLHPAQLGEIVRLENQGPDVLDEPMDSDDSSTALKPYIGEIKGILT
jgi:formamidopyrimidine-DNA glycosylase